MFSQFSVFLCLLLSSLMSSAYQTCSGPRYLLPLSWEESWVSQPAYRKGGSWEPGPHAFFLCQTLFLSFERNLRDIDRNLTNIDGNRRQKFTEINGDFRVFLGTMCRFPVTFTFSAGLRVSLWKTSKLSSNPKLLKITPVVLPKTNIVQGRSGISNN